MRMGPSWRVRAAAECATVKRRQVTARRASAAPTSRTSAATTAGRRSPPRPIGAAAASRPRTPGRGGRASPQSGARTSSSKRSPRPLRNHSPIGAAKPIFGRSTWSAGISRLAIARRRTLVVLPSILSLDREPGDELDQLVIEQRGPRLERIRHGRPIHLDQEVLGQVGQEVGPEQAVDRRPLGPARRTSSRYGAVPFRSRSSRCAIVRPEARHLGDVALVRAVPEQALRRSAAASGSGTAVPSGRVTTRPARAAATSKGVGTTSSAPKMPLTR